MKVGFSTICCPEWSLETIVSRAKKYAYSSIDLRGIKDQLYVTKLKEFSKKNIDATKAFIRSSRVNIMCITSECYLYDGIEYLMEAKKCIELASYLGVPFVRVLGDKSAEPGTVNTDIVFSMLKSVDEAAKGTNVIPLMETNGVYANSLFLKQIFEEGNLKNMGILWDIHHPYVYYKESPEYTFSNIGEYVKHVHIKDSVVNHNKVEYKLTGEGNVPIERFVKILKANGYKGSFTLEWVKRWHSELEDADIVLPHYKKYMNSLK